MRKLETVLNVLLTLSAIVVAGTLLYRTVTPQRPPTLEPTAPTFYSDWRDAIALGHIEGSPDAPITLVEFADFECPFCKRFEEILARLRVKYGNQLSVVFVHYPISSHRMALPAARAAECAGDQGRFASMQHNLFALQDSLGLLPWSEIARRSEVADLQRFDACVKRTESVPRVAESKKIADRMGLRGTPMIVINGWRYNGIPADSMLDVSIDLIRAGKSPADAFESR